MKPIKLLLSAFLLYSSFSSSAAGIKFITGKTWKEVLQLAKKENKLIFLDAYTTWCGPCKYLQSSVFTDINVGAYYNNNFINVKMDMEEGEGIQLAEKFEVESYPTLFFINAEDAVVHKKIGAMEASEFLQLGKIAKDPNKQFFTIKRTAARGTINSENFHNWIHEARTMNDPDTDSVIVAYLKTKKMSLTDAYLMEIFIDHATLNKEQVDYIFKNKARCMELLGRSAEDFTEDLLRIARSVATDISLHDKSMDFALFETTIHEYFPEKSFSETAKIRIRFYHYSGDNKRSLDELAQSIISTKQALKASELAEFVIEFTDQIVEMKRSDEFIQKIGKYKLSSSETGLEYCRDLALLSLYLKLDAENNISLYGNKILQDKNAPEEIKNSVRRALQK